MDYSLNTDLFNQNFTPPTKRKVKTLAWGKMLLSGIQYVRDLFFNDYVDGNVDTKVVNWSAATTYAIGRLVYYEPTGFIYVSIAISTGNLPTNATYFTLKSFSVGNRIRYANKAVYECILINPLGISPLSTLYWIKIQESFIGLNERTKTNSQILLFEYLLNKYFDTIYNYPAGVNDIYIINNDTGENSFVFGIYESESSAIAVSDTEQETFIANSLTIQPYNFSIKFPIAAYDALKPLEAGGSTTNKDNIVRFFADNYVCSGIIYNILPY